MAGNGPPLDALGNAKGSGNTSRFLAGLVNIGRLAFGGVVSANGTRSAAHSTAGSLDLRSTEQDSYTNAEHGNSQNSDGE